MFFSWYGSVGNGESCNPLLVCRQVAYLPFLCTYPNSNLHIAHLFHLVYRLLILACVNEKQKQHKTWQHHIATAISCDPAPLNEALWGKHQNLDFWFIAMNTIFYTFWCKNDYSMIFLSIVTACWTLWYVWKHSKPLCRSTGSQRL